MNVVKKISRASAYFFIILSLTHVSLSFGDAFQAGVSAIKRGHYSTAMRAWIPLAERGIPQAQNNVGHLYEEGYGVSQNYTEAMNWYKKAANQGLQRRSIMWVCSITMAMGSDKTIVQLTSGLI